MIVGLCVHDGGLRMCVVYLLHQAGASKVGDLEAGLDHADYVQSQAFGKLMQVDMWFEIRLIIII